MVKFAGCVFQLTAARRRLALTEDAANEGENISTHSRAKAAGTSRVVAMILDNISTHSRAKAAGLIPQGAVLIVDISTHSRAKAAGFSP